MDKRPYQRPGINPTTPEEVALAKRIAEMEHVHQVRPGMLEGAKRIEEPDVVTQEVEVITELLTSHATLIGPSTARCPACTVPCGMIVQPAAFQVVATEVQLIGVRCPSCNSRFIYVVEPR